MLVFLQTTRGFVRWKSVSPLKHKAPASTEPRFTSAYIRKLGVRSCSAAAASIQPNTNLWLSQKLKSVFYSTYFFFLFPFVWRRMCVCLFCICAGTPVCEGPADVGAQGWQPPLLFHLIQWGGLQISSRTRWNGWPYRSACSGGFPVLLFWAEMIPHLHGSRGPECWSSGLWGRHINHRASYQPLNLFILFFFCMFRTFVFVVEPSLWTIYYKGIRHELVRKAFSLVTY